MRFAIVLVAACGSSPPPPLAARAEPEVPPPTRFALLDSVSRQLRVLAVVPGKPTLATERTIEVSDWTFAVAWAGPSALAVTAASEGMASVGVVEGRSIAPLPPIAWPAVPQPDTAAIPGNEMRAFTADDQKELVIANCAWRSPDGFEWRGECEGWQYARLWPPPIAVLARTPSEDSVPLPLPKVTQAEVTAAVANDGDSVTCIDAHGRHELEPPERGALAVDWLVADPPIWRFATTAGSGFTSCCTSYRVFEGCEPSKRFTNGFAGPRGEIVLVGSELAVYWHGRLVATGTGRTDAGDTSSYPLVVAFAPP